MKRYLLILFLLLIPGAVFAQDPAPTPVPIPEGEPGPSSLSGEYWVGAQADQLKYSTEREATAALWEINKAMFFVSDALAAFRDAMLGLFSHILTVVGRSLLPIVQPILLLGALLALIGILLRPALGTQIVAKVTTVPRVLVLAVFLMLLLPTMGVIFTTFEQIRLDLSQSIGALVFDSAASELQVASGAEMDGTRRLAGVAEGYVYSTRADVDATTDRLPTAFEQAFYTVPPSDWSDLGANTRHAYLSQARLALKRMTFAMVPTLLVVIDSILQALYTFMLGMLFLALTICLVFAVFGFVAASVYSLATMIFNLVVEAWIVSAVQGVLIAWLLSVAIGGNATHVLGMAGFVLLLHVAFVIALIVLGMRALFNAGSAVLPDAPEVASQGLRMASSAVLTGASAGIAGGVAAITMADRVLARGATQTRRFGARMYAEMRNGAPFQ